MSQSETKLKACILPWINFNTNPFGRSRPCGYSREKSPNKVQDSSIAEEFNNELFQSIRRDFINGKWPENCQRCQYIEDKQPGHSKKSSEEIFYNQYQSLIDQTEKSGRVKHFPKQIDIRLGTLCNLKCIHCGTGNSSKWLEDKALIGKYQNTESIVHNNDWVSNENEMWNDVIKNLGQIEKFNFQGGEPFASRQHNRLLEKIVALKMAHKITLHYVTNATLLTDGMIDLLAHFKQVTINVSFDASGDVLSFYRFPMKLESFYRILENLQKKKATQFDLGLQWTSSNVSLFYLDETIDFYLKNLSGFQFKLCNFVDRPIQMSSQNLPNEIKRMISEKVSRHLERFPEIQFYLDHMNEVDLWEKHGTLLVNYLDDLSNARKQDWRKSFKELSELIR